MRPEDKPEEEGEGVSLVGSVKTMVIPAFVDLIRGLTAAEGRSISQLLSDCLPEESILNLLVQVSEFFTKEMFSEIKDPAIESLSTWIKTSKVPTVIAFRETALCKRLVEAESSLSKESSKALVDIVFDLLAISIL